MYFQIEYSFWAWDPNLVTVAHDHGSESSADLVAWRQETWAASLHLPDDHCSGSMVSDSGCNGLEAVVVDLSWQGPRITGEDNLQESENNCEIHCWLGFCTDEYWWFANWLVLLIYKARACAPYRPQHGVAMEILSENSSTDSCAPKIKTK